MVFRCACACGKHPQTQQLDEKENDITLEAVATTVRSAIASELCMEPRFPSYPAFLEPLPAGYLHKKCTEKLYSDEKSEEEAVGGCGVIESNFHQPDHHPPDYSESTTSAEGSESTTSEGIETIISESTELCIPKDSAVILEEQRRLATSYKTAKIITDVESILREIEDDYLTEEEDHTSSGKIIQIRQLLTDLSSLLRSSTPV